MGGSRRLEGRPTSIPTLRDVAEAAGVSLATASRVVNGSTRQVAESYRLRVEAAAEALGYSANLSAQATVKGTSTFVGLLVADIADPYFGRIAAGVARGADEEGLVLTVAMTQRDDEREARIIRALRGQRPRGLILASSRAEASSSGAPASALADLAGAGSRIVTLGRGATVGETIAIPNYEGGRLLGAALAELGYREAVAVFAAEGVFSSDDRLNGFAAGFAPRGRVVRTYRPGFTADEAARAARAAIDDGLPHGTVIVCVSDVVAIATMTELRRAGRSVGTDVAVAGFDDISASRDVTPDLTTVRLPLEEIGLQAVRAITSITSSEADSFAAQVVVRGSTPRRT